jgi:hypothetical protein
MYQLMEAEAEENLGMGLLLSMCDIGASFLIKQKSSVMSKYIPDTLHMKIPR